MFRPVRSCSGGHACQERERPRGAANGFRAAGSAAGRAPSGDLGPSRLRGIAEFPCRGYANLKIPPLARSSILPTPRIHKSSSIQRPNPKGE
ncbi:Hypothetical protein NTJ_07506 [Nesidiocoris tenuis]|uniref:Uncharacterized protein n=1 Tax=Nesidiocoris tenuis TaxID=355587 RepID=A0ABN7ATM1_9HEMI|nr:Hypothetical protein NTJ_07506 [Nesidiocoris tenuis]